MTASFVWIKEMLQLGNNMVGNISEAIIFGVLRVAFINTYGLIIQLVFIDHANDSDARALTRVKG